MDLFSILHNREVYGHFSQSNDRFPRYWGRNTSNLSGVESLVRRLERSKVLVNHSGCINTVRYVTHPQKPK